MLVIQEDMLKTKHYVTNESVQNYLGWQGHIQYPCPLDIVAIIRNMQGRATTQWEDLESPRR